MIGRIKKFDRDKGYGFIRCEDGKDVFFHYSQLVIEGYKDIDPDVEVEFKLVKGQRGDEAHSIIKIGEARV